MCASGIYEQEGITAELYLDPRSVERLSTKIAEIILY
jgi:hypothetical protein